MKIQFLLFIAIAGLTASCQNNLKTAETADSTSNPIMDAGQGTQACYGLAKNRDTATLKLNISGTEVTGTLSYHLYEKDKNTGTIAGTVKGDTIVVDYTFNSEGTRSVRQVAFLKKGNQLLEGIGDVEDKNGKIAFKNPQNLKFEQYMVFNKVACK